MNKKILLIVEGEKVEPKFFDKLQKEFSIDFEIYCFGTNIYSLYKILEDNDFNVNIKDILIELHPESKASLSNNFVYTYLIFDLDPHHSKKLDLRSKEQIIHDNVEKVLKMAEYFVDETDPTVGKLYINYPMMESYKACNAFFDSDYKNEFVDIYSLVKFKEYVGKKNLSNVRIDNYTKDNFAKLMLQNIYKANYISSGKWDKPSYIDYLALTDTKRLLIMQKEIIKMNRQIAVLNTSIFLVLDYFGNRDSFYDKLNV